MTGGEDHEKPVPRRLGEETFGNVPISGKRAFEQKIDIH
jgi:hypothetical protein